MGNEDSIVGVAATNHRADVDNYERLLREAQRPLYDGCTGFTIVELLHCKVDSQWTNKSFDRMLEIKRRICPKPNYLPESYNACKKMLRGFGLGYENIHACINDCVLFYKEHEKQKDKCPFCNEPRYKHIERKQRKKVPEKVMCYHPLKSRLQRLFMSRHTATAMRWHKDKRFEEEIVMRHSADSIAWKEFDKTYVEFAQDPRNVRLGLATDGFNPFGNMSTSYSMWPVILVPYNLPPWTCMKKPYSMMTLLIPGPKAPGKDLDVYMQPLIDELKELWEDGIQTYDKVSESAFNMCAAVIWTINDFPAYANLSGWSTKGYLACSVCNKDTSSTGIRSKICYTGHRRYLPMDHSFRKSPLFNGKSEMRPSPREFSGHDILDQLDLILPSNPGKHPDNKKRKRREEFELNWTKRTPMWCWPSALWCLSQNMISRRYKYF